MSGDFNDLADTDIDPETESDKDEEGATARSRLRYSVDDLIAFMQLRRLLRGPLVRCTRPCWPAKSLMTSRLAVGARPPGKPPNERSYTLIVC